MNQPDIARVLGNYSTEEFAARQPHPHCQFVNKSKVNHGLLIDRPNIEASRFRHTLATAHDWRRITHEFSGAGQPVDCLLCPSPLLIVVRRGVTRMYDRGSGDPLGIYDARQHSQIDAKKVTRFLVFLAAYTEGAYTLLHPAPLQLSFKGVQRGAFLEPGGHLDVLDKAVAKFYSGAPPFAFVVPVRTVADVRGSGSSSSVVTALQKPEPIADQATLDERFIGEDNLATLAEAYEQTRAWQQADRGEALDTGNLDF